MSGLLDDLTPTKHYAYAVLDESEQIVYVALRRSRARDWVRYHATSVADLARYQIRRGKLTLFTR